ncbi:MAG: hypothetical protein C0391_07165 [Anaerolinea sp.]|nr:hypothetical protein [Anaerolinea sp.]
MTRFKHPFTISEGTTNPIQGHVELEQPLPYQTKSGGSGFYRPARLQLDDGSSLDLVIYHNPFTSAFIYIQETEADPNLLDLTGLSKKEIASIHRLRLPGQLIMGAKRTELIGHAVDEILGAPLLYNTITPHRQQNLAVFPIAREGLKYGVAEAIYHNYGYYCDEILLDAHHVFDSSVPVYNRKVELGIFKDKDLDKGQKDKIKVAFIADSIASGLVMKEVIARISVRFEYLENVEVVSPLTTIRGLCRLAQDEACRKTHVRLHVFETLLNALPPDYYYSAHYNIPELHIVPELDREYRAWWGKDASGNAIADTACAGYGWSEVFYSPRKQIQMMNGELTRRHGVTITDIIRKNLL